MTITRTRKDISPVNKLLPTAVAIALVTLPSAGCGPGRDYNADVVRAFSPAHHVFNDSAAARSLTSSQVDGLNNQIIGTGRPIYVANIDATMSGATSPDSLYSTWVKLAGRFAGVIVVMDKTGYHAAAYQVTQQVAAQVGPAIVNAKAHHKGKPFDAMTEFVSVMNGVVPPMPNAPTPTPVPSSSYAPPPQQAPQPAHEDHTRDVLAFFGWLLGILGAVGLGIASFVLGSRARKRRRERIDRARTRYLHARGDVVDVNNAVYRGASAEVSEFAQKAVTALDQADQAFKAKKWNDAEAHVSVAEDAIADADRLLKPDEAAVEQMREDHDEKEDVQVTAVDPATRKKVTFRNTDYRTRREGKYRHHWAGGSYKGVPFEPGYYPHPFPNYGWSPTDVILMDAMLNHDRDRDRDVIATNTSYGDDSRAEASNWDRDSNWDTPASQPSYNSGTTSTSYGDDDDDRGSHYEAPSYDPPSFTDTSFGGSDWGGGSDSGTTSTDGY